MGRKAKIIFLSLCLALAGLAGQVSLSRGGSVDKCLECHRDTWEEAETARYIHLPFQQKKCLQCHESRKARNQRRQEEKRKTEGQVSWLKRNPAPSTVQWLNFKADPYGGTLLVEAKGAGVGVNRRRIKLPPVDDLEMFAGDGPPLISNVKVVEVERGIFLSARITWDTDQPATSLVRYGTRKLNHNSGFDSTYVGHHEVVVTGIKSNKNYRFKVESESISGGRAVSEEKKFSTARAFKLKEAPLAGAGNGDGELRLKCKAFRSGSDQYILRVTASHPVAVAVGLVPDEKDKGYGASDSGSEVVRHIITSNDLFANVTVCYTCHREYKKILSHPINVYPKPGMIVPAEYPTLSDGRISCNSCHASHASNIRFRLIKSGKKELCVGCHKDMA